MHGFMPIVKPIAKAIGKRVLKAGAGFVGDVIEGKPFGDAARDRIPTTLTPYNKIKKVVKTKIAKKSNT